MSRHGAAIAGGRGDRKLVHVTRDMNLVLGRNPTQPVNFAISFSRNASIALMVLIAANLASFSGEISFSIDLR